MLAVEYTLLVPKGEYLQYGGMAILEGVMMRSPNHYAVACRAPDKTIVVHAEPIRKNWARTTLVKIPIVRGAVALIDSMALGIRAMNFSADIQLREQGATGEMEEGGVKAEHSDVRVDRGQSLATRFAVGGAIFTGLALSFLLFQASPVWIAQLFEPFGVRGATALNLIEGLVKVVVFLGYLALIGNMGAVKDLFRYHGAEHKAINCLEKDLPLTIENVREQTRLHPRCGTSFMIIVLILSIIVFTFLPRNYNTGSTFLDLLVRIGFKVPILPLIAGVAYEGIRWAGKMKNQKLLLALFWPGLMTQYLTTREPDEAHIDVALVSLKAAVEAEAAGQEAKAVAVAGA